MRVRDEASGRVFNFPDDATEEQVSEFMAGATRPPQWADVYREVPGDVRRHLAGTAAGAVTALSDAGVLSEDAGKEAAGARGEINLEAQEHALPTSTMFQQGVRAGMGSAVGQFPAALVAAGAAPAVVGALGPLAGGAALLGGVTTSMGFTTGLEKYGELRDYGFAPKQSALHAAFHGLVEKYTEYLPMSEFRFLGNKLVGNLAKYIGKEFLGEQAATALQDLNDKVTTRPDMTLGDWLHDAAITAIATATSAPLQTGAIGTVTAMMQPFIKPENITDEQNVQLRDAALRAGVSAEALMGLDLTQDGMVRTPGIGELGAVETSPPPFVDLVDLSMPDKTAPVPDGMVRVYSAIAPNEQTPQHLLWTPDLDKVQQLLNVMGPQTRVAYLDMVPEELALAQEPDQVQELRKDMHAADNEFLLPGSFAERGTWLYNPPQETPATPPAVTPEPANQAATRPVAKPELTYIYKPDKDHKVRVEFADPMSKQLFVYAQRADNLGTYSTEEELAAQRVELAHHFQVPTEEVGALAKAYRDEVVDVANGIMKQNNPVLRPPAFNKQEYMERKQADDLPEVKVRKELAKHAKPGVLFVNPDMQQTKQARRLIAFIAKWHKMFAPETRLVVEGTTPDNTAKYRREAGVGFIVLPHEHNPMFWNMFSVAHEFGHHIFDTILLRPEFAEARAVLKAEWQAFMSDLPGMTAEQFIERWMSPRGNAFKQAIYDNYGLKPDDSAQALVAALEGKRHPNALSLLTFEEYSAEQFAIYVAKNYRTTLGGEVGRFFRQVVKELKAFYNMAAGKFMRAAAPQPSFEKWVDSLRLSNRMGIETDVSALTAREVSNDVYFDLADLEHIYTLKLLQRLPKKDKIQRITIIGELSRQDVKEQERRLVQGVLDTIDGDVIDRTIFTQKLHDAITPLELMDVPEYGSYGLSRIGVSDYRLVSKAKTTLFRLPFDVSSSNHFSDPRYFGHLRSFVDEDGTQRIVEVQSDLVQREVSQENTPEALAQAERKVEDLQKAIADATREFRELEKDPIGFPDEPASDFAVRGSNGFWTTKYGTSLGRFLSYKWPFITHNYTHSLGALQQLETDGKVKIEWGDNDYVKKVEVSPEQVRTNWGDLYDAVRAAWSNYVEITENNLADTLLTVQRLREQLEAGVPTRLNMLPKRWWEFMLRRFNAELANRGVTRAAIGTADTVAEVEGWFTTEGSDTLVPVNPDLLAKYDHARNTYRYAFDSIPHPMEVGRELQEVTDPSPYSDKVWKLAAVVDDPEYGMLAQFQPQGGEHHGAVMEGIYVQLSDVKEGLPADWGFLPDNAMAWTPPEARRVIRSNAKGIYNRYKNEITKFVKREFGAKEELGSRYSPSGDPVDHGWLIWDVKPELKDVPVEYYDILDTLTATGEKTESTVQDVAGEDIPELPKYFKRFQSFFQWSLQLNQMAKILPHVEPLQVYRRMMQAMANMKNQLMAGPNERIKQWYSLSKKDSIGVMQMLRDEVRGGQHWTTLAKHKVVIDGKEMEVWTHEMSPRVQEEANARGLSDEAVKLFMGVKRDYTTTLGTMEQALLNAVKEFFVKNPTAGRMRTAAILSQFQKFRETPWVPDQRFGQWHVVIRAAKDTVIDGEAVEKGQVVYRAGFRRKGQMEREVARMKKDYGGDFHVFGTYLEDKVYVLRSLPREFIRNLPETLQLDDAQMEKFRELYFDVTMEGKFYKFFAKEKRQVPGAEQDMRQSYSDYMWRAANMIGKLSYGYKLNQQILALNKLVRRAHQNGASATDLERLHEYIAMNYNYVMTPQHEWEQLRAMVSLWYLWGVPKTALMNGTTLVTTTYPHLAARFGDAKATKEILKAMKDVVAFWKNPENVDREVAALFQHGKADGVLQQSFAAELAAVADGTAIERIMPQYSFMRDSGIRDRVRKATWKMIHYGMVPFRAVEEYNRMTTILAAYRLNKASGLPGLQGGVGEGSAYLKARDAVDFTQNEYAPWNRARFLRGKRSVALIFYSFAQHMAFFMFGGDKGWWRGMLMLMALGGVQGLPGAENIFDFLDWLGRISLGKPVNLRQDAREMAQLLSLNPDFVMHGAFHSNFGLGWDTSGSVSLGRLIPGTDAIFGQGEAHRRIVQMAGEVGGPFGSLTMNIIQAMMDDNPNMLLRMERALPPLVRNLSRAYRGATEDRWTDTQGRTVIDEVTGLEVLGQVAGFNPTVKSRMQESRHFQREAAQFYVLRRQNLMTMWWQARQARDPEAIADVRQAIAKYNSDVPDRQLKITQDDLKSSERARERSAREIETGVAAVSRYRPLYERVRGAFPDLGER